jgi:hypothetical protein
MLLQQMGAGHEKEFCYKEVPCLNSTHDYSKFLNCITFNCGASNASIQALHLSPNETTAYRNICDLIIHMK